MFFGLSQSIIVFFAESSMLHANSQPLISSVVLSYNSIEAKVNAYEINQGNNTQTDTCWRHLATTVTTMMVMATTTMVLREQVHNWKWQAQRRKYPWPRRWLMAYFKMVSGNRLLQSEVLEERVKKSQRARGGTMSSVNVTTQGR